MGKHLQILTRAVNQLGLGGVSQKRPQRAEVIKLQRVNQIGLIPPAQLQQSNLREKRIATAKFGIDRHHGVVPIIGQQRVQRLAALDQRPAHSRTTVLPLSACASVLASVYSNSPPSGTPCAMRDTVTVAARARSLM